MVGANKEAMKEELWKVNNEYIYLRLQILKYRYHPL